MLQPLRFALLLLLLAVLPAGESLPAVAGVPGGLCLVSGATALKPALELAAGGAFYVQVLQPDPALAVQWGAEVAGSAQREAIGIRHAALDPAHYGSQVINLIVAEDALAGIAPAELARILVPNGVLACRVAPAPALAVGATAAGLVELKLPGCAAAWRRTPPAWTWKPADSLKWRAGMRAHMAYGICGPTHGAGRFYYREQIEAAGGWPDDTTQLVARDAYNGRVLWVKQEDTPFKTWRASQFVHGNWTMGADESGRLFTVTKDGRLVCLDGATGAERFVLAAKGVQPEYVRVWKDTYVLHANTVYAAADGKLLWKWRGPFMELHDDQLLESDGATLTVRKLADGSEVLKADLAWRGERIAKKKGLDIHHCGSRIVITEGGRWDRPFIATGLDPATGAKVWSHEYGGLWALPAQAEKGKPIFANSLGYFQQGDAFVAYAVSPYFHEVKDADQKEGRFTALDLATGKVLKENYGNQAKLFGSACAGGPAVLGDYLVYHLNTWLNTRTMERIFPYLVHASCFLQPPTAYGMVYHSPGRKGGSIQGITATGPADLPFDQEPGGKVLVRYAPRPAFAEATKSGDWPTFRGGNARGNAFATSLGLKLEKRWEAKVGLGGKTWGRMESERTGLTQATVAYGLAYVADIDAQRVVALDLATGAEKWVRHLGSRVDFPPTLYKGLCLVASKDGFVHCLDARTGQPVYKMLIAPRERYIGGQEKLESLWPTAADVMVDKDGVGRAWAGFASTIHGGNREVAFNPETGEVVAAKVNFEVFTESGYPHAKNHSNIYTEPLPGGWRLTGGAIDSMLAFGNDISRTNEDRAGDLFGDRAGGKHGVDGRAMGRVIAFDEQLCVAHFMPYGGQSWAIKNPLHLYAVDKDPKTPLWKSEPIELIADDLLLTPEYVYCVGHYRRVKGDPEIWILSRADGKVQAKVPVAGFPAFFGMSATGNRLLVATREGSLICYAAP